MEATADAYLGDLDRFLEERGLHRGSDPVAVFHAVRRIPYGSRGGRNPRTVIASNEGSCSGKHLLLRDLLRHLGHNASVETVEGDFAAGLPAHPSMPPALRAFCDEGGVRDFHQYVVWERPDGEIRLDATWSDGPIEHGVPGNRDWAGKGDTVIALNPERVHDRVEDLPPYKAGLLQRLGPDQTRRRTEFLTLLTAWVATTERGGNRQWQQ